MPKRLILASASPRRKEVLECLGLPFEIIPSTIDESTESEVNAPTLAKILAVNKANDVADRVWNTPFHESGKWRDPLVVLGCDTIVVTDRTDGPSILGKPTSGEDAKRMLGLLSGGIHTVYTGVSIVTRDWPREWLAAAKVMDTQVQFRELSPAIIDWYVATGEPFDKAGAYGIQGHASVFVEAVYGDYFNVVGLPISTVAKMLEEIGIKWWRGAAALE